MPRQADPLPGNPLRRRPRSRQRLLGSLPPGALAVALCLGLGTPRLARATPSDPAPSPPPTPSNPQSPGAPVTDEGDLRRLFVRATEAADRGELEAARALFAEIWAVRQTYDVALNLAELEAHLGRTADAATHAAFALAEFPPSEDPATREHLEGLLERTRRGLAPLTVTAPMGARLSVDGVFVGRAPLPAPLYVAAGERRLEASEGTETAATVLVTVGGEPAAVSLRFDDNGTTGTATAATDAAPAGSDRAAGRSALRGPLWVSAGLAVVGGGLGFGYALAANDARGDAEALDTDEDGRCLTAPDSPACIELAEAWERVDERRTVRDVALVAGGVGLVATGLFAVLIAHEERPRWTSPSATAHPATRRVGLSSLEPELHLGRDGAGLGLRGRF